MIRRAVALGIAVALTFAVPASAAATPPNDPGYVQQWGLAKIHAVEAWALSRGNGVVVAVVDTGVDAAHPDLRGKVLPGHDFVDGDADASDQKGHGTHVSGTIAAITGNGLGVASVAPGAKILPVRVLASNGEGDPGNVADGIRWAVSHGARVVNLSLAQDDELPAGGEALLRDNRVDEAIRFAARSNAVVVVAAGNSDSGGKPHTAYSSRTPGVLVVGATTKADRRAAYSNYGSGLDVVAPGGGSVTDAKVCSEDNWVVSTWWNPSTHKDDYGGGCGTSMAVAHVSGVAALLIARGYSAAGAAARIESTAVDLGVAGRDDDTGYGRVDAFRALAGAGKASSSSQGKISTAQPSASPIRLPKGRPEPTNEAIGSLPAAPGAGRAAPAGVAIGAISLLIASHAAVRRRRSLAVRGERA